MFLPNYDIGMAQLLYPGTDVWLNNPLRPLEACGTSGMKAALNGALNLSILDGWWNEFYDGENGWAIPSADAPATAPSATRSRPSALYDLIENQIAPRFYDRDGDGVPTRWVAHIRHTLATLSPELSADRMVREYVERLYVPAAARRARAQRRRLRRRRASSRPGRRASRRPGRACTSRTSSPAGWMPSPQVGDELHVRALVAARRRCRPTTSRWSSCTAARATSDHLVDTGTVTLELDSTIRRGVGNYAGTVPLERGGQLRLHGARGAEAPAARLGRRARAHRRRVTEARASWNAAGAGFR